jgi:hypothetical protein
MFISFHSDKFGEFAQSDGYLNSSLRLSLQNKSEISKKIVIRKTYHLISKFSINLFIKFPIDNYFWENRI